jgi:hypothetical protein
MAENINALILPIGADPSQFKKSIEEVKGAIKKLSTSISSTSFNLVSPEQKTELANLKRTLSELQTDVINTGNAFAKGEESTKKAGRALTSLSLVAQDAPFGFIGIQNNLPALIQSFGELTKTSAGVKGALSQIGSALIGPAGLFLAFSAVTAAITYAIKEYGSLTNALNVLFGANANAVKSQNDYNKALLDAGGSTGSQIAKINILVKTIQDENTSQKDRLAAYRELKRVNPDVVAGIDEQNLSTAKSIKLIGENAKAQLEYIKLQTKASAISKALDGLEGRRFEANGKYNAAREKQIKLEERLSAIDQKKSLGKALTAQEKTTDSQRELLRLEYGDKVKKASDEIAGITKEQDKWTNSLQPTITSLSQISSAAEDLTNNLKKLRDAEKDDFKLSIESQDLDAAFNLEKIISSITKYGNAILDTNNSVEERKNALKELIAINPQVFSGLSLEKSATLSNKDAIESYLRSLEVLKKEKEFNARASQINAEFLKAEQKSQEQAAKAEEDRLENLIKLTYAQDEYGNSTDKIVKKNNTYLNQLGEIQELNQGVIDILTKGLGVENVYEKAIKDLLNFEAYQKSAVERISKNFRFLQNPLEDLFGSVIEDGIANWQAFGDAVVSEIKKIAAALLAKSFITLLGNLLAPGVGSLLGGAFSGISTDALGDWLDIFDPQPSKVNFGGVQGGGMQMAGAVNLTLRGSDLVGAINRTNSTINRVG